MFVFLACGAMGIACGWYMACALHLGGRSIPPSNTPLALTLRITPKTAYLLAKHASGIPLAPSCPLDAPTLVHLARPSRILATYTETSTTLALTTKKEAMDTFASWNHMYGCTISQASLRSSRILPTLAPLHMFAQGRSTTLKLGENGLTFTRAQSAPTAATPWPGVSSLLYALPKSNETFPMITPPLATFTWESADNFAWGFSFTSTPTDEELMTLAYTFSNISEQEATMTRADDARYTTRTAPVLSFAEITPQSRIIQTPENNPVAWITELDNGTTLFATENISWNIQRPTWIVRAHDIQEHAPSTHHRERTWFTAITSTALHKRTQTISWE